MHRLVWYPALRTSDALLAVCHLQGSVRSTQAASLTDCLPCVRCCVSTEDNSVIRHGPCPQGAQRPVMEMTRGSPL